MYRVIGADQREYGPVSGEQLRAWIAQGRVNARTLVQGEGNVGWKPLADFAEFSAALTQAGPPAYPTTSLPPIATDNNMALASLIVACLSLVCCQPLAIVGLILGVIALNQTKSDPRRTGRGLAIAAIAVSAASMILAGLLLGLGAFREVFEKVFR
jgi:hypothetical protein